MNAQRFHAIIQLGRDDTGRTVLPVADPTVERVFGGQMLAQLVAAAAPAGSGKAVKSLQVAFPREARPRSPLYLDLETTHDGRSVGLRRAAIWQEIEQSRRIVATASILVDQPDEAFEYQLDPVVPGDPTEAKPAAFTVVPGESRLISEVGLDDDRALPAEFSFWMCCEDLEGASLGRAVVAYVSDWPIIGTLLRAVPGVSERDSHVQVQTGVVTHSLWFHQPFDAAAWLRVEVRGQRLTGGRGFGTGAVYTQAGSLVASFAQESVIRRPRS